MWKHQYSKMLAVALVTAVVTVGAPVAARTVVQYASNSDKVDGRHAVGAGSTQTERARKLVATNKEGFLPNDIIRSAPNADALGGDPASRYVAKCEEGALAGSVSLPSGLGDAWTPVQGYVLLHLAGGAPPGVDVCDQTQPQARRVAEGSYQMQLTGEYGICTPDATVPVVLTPQSQTPVIATQSISCADGATVLEVRTWTPQGEAVDAPVDVAILSPVKIPLP